MICILAMPRSSSRFKISSADTAIVLHLNAPDYYFPSFFAVALFWPHFDSRLLNYGPILPMQKPPLLKWTINVAKRTNAVGQGWHWGQWGVMVEINQPQASLLILGISTIRQKTFFSFLPYPAHDDISSGVTYIIIITKKSFHSRRDIRRDKINNFCKLPIH